MITALAKGILSLRPTDSLARIRGGEWAIRLKLDSEWDAHWVEAIISIVALEVPRDDDAPPQSPWTCAKARESPRRQRPNVRFLS